MHPRSRIETTKNVYLTIDRQRILRRYVQSFQLSTPSNAGSEKKSTRVYLLVDVAADITGSLLEVTLCLHLGVACGGTNGRLNAAADVVGGTLGVTLGPLGLGLGRVGGRAGLGSSLLGGAYCQIRVFLC